MESEELFVAEQHPLSLRHAIIEDDGLSAWLYLSEPETTRPVADVWVYNRIEAPPVEQVRSYRPAPPPAAAGYASKAALVVEPLQSQWTSIWSKAGDAVAVVRDGEPLAFIPPGEKAGYSRLLVKDGPWGKAWSENVFERTFAAEG